MQSVHGGCTFKVASCMSAHLHIPQALSQSFNRAREGPSCQPARLHSYIPQHTPNRFHIAIHKPELLHCDKQHLSGLGDEIQARFTQLLPEVQSLNLMYMFT